MRRSLATFLVIVVLAAFLALVAHQLQKGLTLDSTIHNVRDYGATGDGVTDDGAAFASAIAATSAGGVMYVPAGTYKVTRQLTLKSDITIQGDGPTSVIVFPSGLSSDRLFHGSG